MSSFDSPWLYWAVGIAVGLPFVIMLLTEVHHALVRRQSRLARQVSLLRNYLVPLGALLLLLVKATEVPSRDTSVRVLTTVFGFMLLLVLVSGLNATVFEAAPRGSWRKRLPIIFLDVARFVVIGAGLAVILSQVWGVRIAGLFTALGVTSVVIGLMLQNSVGQIVSGLFMLFEQPFQIGDWLDSATVRGRIVEVNWRAVHILTDSGLRITPNSVLAGTQFTNLSRPPGAHKLTIETTFGLADPPDRVCALLSRLAGDLPELWPGDDAGREGGPLRSRAIRPGPGDDAGREGGPLRSRAIRPGPGDDAGREGVGRHRFRRLRRLGETTRLQGSRQSDVHGARITSVALGEGKYSTTVRLKSAADDGAAQATFLRWLWYAARRENLHLDEADDDFSTPERVADALRTVVAPALRLRDPDQHSLAAHARIVRYGADEVVEYAGQVPKGMTFVMAGCVQLTATDEDGSIIPVSTVDEGSFVGLTALTRQPNLAGAYAVGEVTALEIDPEYVEDLVMREPLLLQDLGRIIDERQSKVRQAGLGDRDRGGD